MKRPRERQPGFPQRLQSIVEHYGSIAALSEASGISTKTLSDWLRGLRAPHAATVRKLCDAIDVDSAWLSQGDSPEIRWGAGVPAGRQVHLQAIDSGESLLAVSSAWLQTHFGVADQGIFLVHATAADAIPGEIEAREPVLFKQVDGGYQPDPEKRYKTRPKEIVLVSDKNGDTQIHQVSDPSAIPGVVIGTAFWTGRQLNASFRARKNG